MIVGVIFIGRSKSLADCGTDLLEASISEVPDVPAVDAPASPTVSRRPRSDSGPVGLSRPSPRKRLADLEP
jgi:hypothetical protein